ncbi:MAG: nickel-dependent hydrogenase large subunit [Marinilabiliales bacterium]|nr:nickel-dependent hydrogenase large subunit [Marinilabiliales bacterium]
MEILKNLSIIHGMIILMAMKLGKHPWEGETNIKYSGPKPPYESLDASQKYSFIKTPRWRGKPMEVGSVGRDCWSVMERGNKEDSGCSGWGLGTSEMCRLMLLFSTLGKDCCPWN